MRGVDLGLNRFRKSLPMEHTDSKLCKGGRFAGSRGQAAGRSRRTKPLNFPHSGSGTRGLRRNLRNAMACGRIDQPPPAKTACV